MKQGFIIKEKDTDEIEFFTTEREDIFSVIAEQFGTIDLTIKSNLTRSPAYNVQLGHTDLHILDSNIVVISDGELTTGLQYHAVDYEDCDGIVAGDDAIKILFANYGEVSEGGYRSITGLSQEQVQELMVLYGIDKELNKRILITFDSKNIEEFTNGFYV